MARLCVTDTDKTPLLSCRPPASLPECILVPLLVSCLRHHYLGGVERPDVSFRSGVRDPAYFASDTFVSDIRRGHTHTHLFLSRLSCAFSKRRRFACRGHHVAYSLAFPKPLDYSPSAWPRRAQAYRRQKPEKALCRNEEIHQHRFEPRRVRIQLRPLSLCGPLTTLQANATFPFAALHGNSHGSVIVRLYLLQQVPTSWLEKTQFAPDLHAVHRDVPVLWKLQRPVARQCTDSPQEVL